jgi:hypothetical protein
MRMIESGDETAIVAEARQHVSGDAVIRRLQALASE